MAKTGGMIVDNSRFIHKKNPPERVFSQIVLREQKTINVWRTADDDVLYADRLSYVQPDERHE
ncbi:hypothetical protein NUKP67_20510 [Klebsiella variicola]|nr:hypothetical protein NUKP67_20510 [Klebsiella variicola]